MTSGIDVVAQAAKELGDPYVYGATGPNTFDCSGLVQFVYKKFGIKVPRVAADQANFGTAVTRAKLQPGDLIFFSWDGGRRADHVGIYAGNGEMIHAPHRGTVVKKVKLSKYYWANAIGFRRYPGIDGGPETSEPSGGLGGVVGTVTGAVGALTPGSITGVLGGIRDQIAGIAGGVASVGKVAELITHAFLPSNILRGVAGLMGAVFLLLGIWFLTREVRA